jgi:hypothetical protein
MHPYGAIAKKRFSVKKQMFLKFMDFLKKIFRCNLRAHYSFMISISPKEHAGKIWFGFRLTPPGADCCVCLSAGEIKQRIKQNLWENSSSKVKGTMRRKRATPFYRGVSVSRHGSDSTKLIRLLAAPTPLVNFSYHLFAEAGAARVGAP